MCLRFAGMTKICLNLYIGSSHLQFESSISLSEIGSLDYGYKLHSLKGSRCFSFYQLMSDEVV